MADLNLKTTYKDDILDTTQNTKRKFHMIQNEDGTVSFEDVTDYSQIGDSFGAADVNAITEAINEVSEEISNKVSISSWIKWKRLGSTSAGSYSVNRSAVALNIPLLVVVKPEDNSYYRIPIVIGSFDSGSWNFSGTGYYNGTTVRAHFQLTENTVKLIDAYVGTNSVKSSTTFIVYYLDFAEASRDV